MQKSVKYMDKWELEKLRNKMMEKLYRDIGKKYKTLILDKEITLDKFTKDFRKEVEQNFDFNNPDYKHFFHEVEKVFLNKITRCPDKRRENLQEKEEIESKLNNMNYDKEQHHLFKERIKNNRVRKEAQKKENEWAKMAKFDYEQYVAEEHRKMIEDKIKRQLLNEDLRKQITDKERHEQEVKEQEERYFNEILQGTLTKLDFEERERNLKSKEMFLKQKDMLLSSMQGMRLIYI
jgi:hypothetical protein